MNGSGGVLVDVTWRLSDERISARLVSYPSRKSLKMSDADLPGGNVDLHRPSPLQRPQPPTSSRTSCTVLRGIPADQNPDSEANVQLTTTCRSASCHSVYTPARLPRLTAMNRASLALMLAGPGPPDDSSLTALATSSSGGDGRGLPRVKVAIFVENWENGIWEGGGRGKGRGRGAMAFV